MRDNEGLSRCFGGAGVGGRMALEIRGLHTSLKKLWRLGFLYIFVSLLVMVLLGFYSFGGWG